MGPAPHTDVISACCCLMPPGRNGLGSSVTQNAHASLATEQRPCTDLARVRQGFAHRAWLKERELPRKPRGFFAGMAERVSRLHDYQARLRMPKEHLELLRKESQTLENNLREILLLTEKIEVLTVLLRDTRAGLHNHSWAAEADAPGAQGHAEDPSKEMSNLVNYVLKKVREDQVQMADYALKSAGASIVEAGTSESYKSNKAKLSWRGVGLLNYQTPPDVVLQPDVHPGKCWAFPGAQGHVLIKLAGDIVPTAVTMEHISEKVSPSGSISSAPKEFSVHGILTQCGGEEVFLGRFVYNKTGATVQTFALQVRGALASTGPARSPAGGAGAACCAAVTNGREVKADLTSVLSSECLPACQGRSQANNRTVSKLHSCTFAVT
ncbi:SUN domain-containing protein 3 isoform 2-T3 [Glossophaga mutica]